MMKGRTRIVPVAADVVVDPDGAVKRLKLNQEKPSNPRAADAMMQLHRSNHQDRMKKTNPKMKSTMKNANI